MNSPEEAISQARERAARARAEEGGRFAARAGLESSITSDRPSLELLSEWSVIEVDPSNVYSTRRAGAPITALKQLLLRLLRQYHGELEARQTRFNIALLSQLGDLDERVARLELEARTRGRGPRAEPPIR